MAIYQMRDEYLFVQYDEPYLLSSVLRMIHQMAASCAERDINKALVDFTKLDLPVSLIDRYEIGMEAAKFFGSKIQVATVAQPNMVNKFGETVALNRGARVYATHDMNDGLEWLQVESAKS